jgi:hypothetical protein
MTVSDTAILSAITASASVTFPRTTVNLRSDRREFYFDLNLYSVRVRDSHILYEQVCGQSLIPKESGHLDWKTGTKNDKLPSFLTSDLISKKYLYSLRQLIHSK